MTTRSYTTVTAYSVLTVALLLISANAHAYHTSSSELQFERTKFDSLSPNERKAAAEAFMVDSIYNINTDMKPALTEYYINYPEQYGPYALPAHTEYDPYSLLRNNTTNNDNRRYPAFGTVNNCNCGNPYTQNRYRLLDARPVNSTPVYRYENAPVTNIPRTPGVTQYSNFSVNPHYTNRW